MMSSKRMTWTRTAGIAAVELVLVGVLVVCFYYAFKSDDSPGVHTTAAGAGLGPMVPTSVSGDVMKLNVYYPTIKAEQGNNVEVYPQTLVISEKQQPIYFTVKTSLPKGLTLNFSSGAISGSLSE